MTTVQGDGLTISTPTGSTAYSVSTGFIKPFLRRRRDEILNSHRDLGVRWWFTCPPRDPGYPHYAHLSPYFVVQTHVTPRQHGGPNLCSLQLTKHSMGIIRWKGSCRIETYVHTFTFASMNTSNPPIYQLHHQSIRPSNSSSDTDTASVLPVLFSILLYLFDARC